MLSASQRAMAGDKYREYCDARAKERQEATRAKPGNTMAHGGGNVSTTVNQAKNKDSGKSKPSGGENLNKFKSSGDKGKARDQAGRAVGVSGRTMDKASGCRKTVGSAEEPHNGRDDHPKIVREIPSGWLRFGR